MEGRPQAPRDWADTRTETTCTDVFGGYGLERGRHLGGTLRCLGRSVKRFWNGRSPSNGLAGGAYCPGIAGLLDQMSGN